MGTSGIYGLSGSGIDVESMVKVGMMTKQNQYDKLYKSEVKKTWEMEAYNSLYSDLSTFTYTTMSSYKMQSKMNAMLASSSNTNAATATANGAASSMQHTIQVKSMASNAYVITNDDGIKRRDGASQTSIYLTDIIDTSSWDENSSISIDVSDGTTTETLTLTYADVVESKQTLNDLYTAINNLGLNISAVYDSTNDAFSIYSNTGGADNKISLTANNDSSTELLNALNLASVVSSEETDASTGETVTTTKLVNLDSFETSKEQSVAGVDGVAVIDGKTYTTSTNKITASNVTYTLTGKGTSTISVSQDTDSIIESVKQFVEDYNKMIDQLNDLYYETKYSDYEPLTSSQQSSMTEDQIAKWNEKAKSGLLRHSTYVGNIRDALRTALSTQVDSVNSSYNSAYAIGISSSTDMGHISLDEDKLKAALAADPDCVYQIFGSQDADDDYGNTGIANRIYDKCIAGMKSIKEYAGDTGEATASSTLGSYILDLQQKMSDFKTIMDAYETKLYSKYDAMETAIQKLISQSNYVTSS